MTTKSTNTFKCPDCPKSFPKANLLGVHRSIVHGIKGTSAATLEYHRTKKIREGQLPTPAAAAANPLQCPHCAFIGVNKSGLSLHLRKKHEDFTHHSYRRMPKENKQLAKTTQNARPATVNGHIETPQHQAPDDRDHRLEAVAALTCGRIQQIIEGVAFTHDLPAKSLSTLVLRTLVQTAKVWA